MRCNIILPVAMLAVLVCGCETSREQLKRMQSERRVQLDVVQSFRPPIIDAAALADEQLTAGTVKSGRVEVKYPLGMKSLADETARHIAGMYPFVEQHTSVKWSFDVTIWLVRVDVAPAMSVGDRVTPSKGGCVARLFVPENDETLEAIIRSNPLFPYSFVHELTELSLVCPEDGQGPLLLDVVMDDKRIVNHTRWLREGIANYAGQLVTRDYCGAGNRELVHDRPFAALHDAGHMLDQWNAFSNRFQDGRFEKTYYNAALGMILEIVRRKGEGCLKQILDDLRGEKLANGAAIDRAMKRHVGQTPRQLADDVVVPYLGIDPRDLSRARAKNLGIGVPGGVLVLATRPFSPARKAGLKPHDVIVACNGRPALNAGRLESLLMDVGINKPVKLAIKRFGRDLEVSVKPVRRPPLDLTKEHLL